MRLPLDELVAHPQWVNERAQVFDWEDLLFEYEKALDDIQAWLRGLNDAQARYKPGSHEFSIAEVVTHNAFSDELFWNWVKLLAQGRGAEIDPAKVISGDGARNDLSLAALEALNEACRTLGRSVIESLPAQCDLATTAPHPYFGALNAKGWIYFMCVHHGMHLRQCERVIDAPGFPRSSSMQSQPREAYAPSPRKTWLGKKREARSKKRPPGSASRGVKSKGQGAKSREPGVRGKGRVSIGRKAQTRTDKAGSQKPSQTNTPRGTGKKR